MRSILYILVMLLGGCVFALFPAIADDDDAGKIAKEYQVKVAFLYNFVKFIEWPGDKSLAHPNATANICIMGDNPFGAALDIFKRVSTPQLTLNVKTGVSQNDISSCHILYVSKSEEANVSSILSQASRYSVVTVSGIKGFVDAGGVIEMVKVEKSIGLFSKDKINLRINMRAAEAVNLRIDAQLLEIAAEVVK